MVSTRSQAGVVGQELSPDQRRGRSDARKPAAPKRKLFDPADEACAGQATPPGVEVLEARAEAPSAPPTPKTVDRERASSESPTCAPLHPALEPAMICAMSAWRDNLVALQPKVQVADATLLGAMAVMREFAGARPDLHAMLHQSGPHLYTYTGAAMWLVSKACDVRTAIPNRTLMSQACQIHPQALSDFELDLCLSLNWEVTRVLRGANLLH